MIKVPPSFAKRRVQVSGEQGRLWIDALPLLVEQLCVRWGLEIAGEPMTGEVGVVFPVDRSGEPLALKVSWPDEDSKDEAVALAAWNGRGAVRLFDEDREHRALLMERADNSRPLSLLPVDEAVIVAGRLLRTLAVDAPPALPKQADVGHRLTESLIADSRAMSWPVPRDLVAQAIEWIEADQTHESLLINSDLHYDNVLAADREPWLVIDPKVIAGDVEYGVAPLLWNLYRRRSSDQLMDDFESLVRAANADSETARRWTFIRLVDYWLWAVKTGLTEDPKMCAGLLVLLR